MNQEEFEHQAKRIHLMIKRARKAFQYDTYGLKYAKDLEDFDLLVTGEARAIGTMAENSQIRRANESLQSEVERLNQELKEKAK
jgi:hypothetical protein